MTNGLIEVLISNAMLLGALIAYTAAVNKARDGECKHKWEQTKEWSISQARPSGEEVSVGKQYVLTCKYCGDVTSRKAKING